MGLFVAALITATLFRTREIRSPVVQLFRAFFPNWKFFEDLGTLPVLSWRCGKDETSLGPWRSVPRLKPNASRFLFNPEGNLRLALGSLLQHLEADLHSTDDAHPETLEQTISYRLVRNWVETEIRNDPAGPHCHYQFRVLGAQPDPTSGYYTQASDADLMLLSPVYAWPGALLEAKAEANT